MTATLTVDSKDARSAPLGDAWTLETLHDIAMNRIRVTLPEAARARIDAEHAEHDEDYAAPERRSRRR